MPWLTFGVDNRPKIIFQSLIFFFSGWLVAVVMLLSSPENKKIFQPGFFCAYFFRHVPWLSECWYSHTWECFKSPDTPTASFWINMLYKMDGILPATGNIPKGGIRGLKALPSVTAPALAKPWHASAMLHSPQPNAVAEEICKKKITGWNGWKVFSHRDRREAL